MEILPSILESDPTELVNKLEAIRGLGLMPQVDFMDGAFVPSTSVALDELPTELKTVDWEAHLMVQDPVSWSTRLYEFGCKRLYWHAEVMKEGVALPQSEHIEHALALRLETSLDVIEPYSNELKSVLLLAIEKPGYQGEVFQEATYARIAKLKQLHPQIKIGVDGGVKLEHMKALTQAGVDRVAVGSAFWKYDDPRTILASLRLATL